MKKMLVTVCIGCISMISRAQSSAIEQINSMITPDVALAPLEYLASDELKGRSPKRNEINVAADYIAEHIKQFDVKSTDSEKDYFQLFYIKVQDSSGERMVPAKNVIGFIKGTDAALQDQFVVLSAHYDHLGVAPQPKMVEGKMDSIYNGARDNAVGVTAVMNAATYFSKHPPKRSILFIAFTGEEMGMLGSRYFANHPVIPFKRMVYDLNCDNGGYNDTTIFTIVGL